MLGKINWWSFLIGALFVMFIWPWISSKISSRGAQSSRTA